MSARKEKNRYSEIGAPFFSHALLVVGLWAASLLSYWNSFGVPYQFDDFDFVRNNEVIRHLDRLGDIWNFHSTRFLTFLSFALDYRVHGLSVFGFHLVNFLIHGVAVTSVYAFAFLFFSADRNKHESVATRLGAPFLVALLFACHPLQTEAVTYISQRPASLMAACYILSLTLYLGSSICRERREKSRARLLLVAALVFGLMAMFSKQSAITLPVAIVLLEACRFGFPKTNWREKALRISPFFLIAALVPVTALVFTDVERVDGLLQTKLLPNHGVHIWTEISVVGKYLGLLFWPMGQNVDHDVLLKTTFWDPPTLLCLVLHGALLVWAFRSRKKNPALCFGIFFFYLALSVESFLVVLADKMIEHRLYLPSLGIFLGLAGLARQALKAWDTGHPLRSRFSPAIWVWLGLSLLAIPLGVLTHARNEVWRSEEALWLDSAKKSPGKPRPLVNLSRIFYGQGHCDWALDPLRVAITNGPGFYSAHSLLGHCLLQLGRPDDAIPEFNRALSLSRELKTTFNNVREESYFGLGQAYAAKGDETAALGNYRECVKMGGIYSIFCFEGMGRTLAGLHQVDAAIDAFQKAIHLAQANGVMITRAGIESYLGELLARGSRDDIQNAQELSHDVGVALPQNPAEKPNRVPPRGAESELSKRN